MRSEKDKTLNYFKNKLRELVGEDGKQHQDKVIGYYILAIEALKVYEECANKN